MEADLFVIRSVEDAARERFAAVVTQATAALAPTARALVTNRACSFA